MIALDQVQGHWQRHWIKTPDFEDHATQVSWMQTGRHYADLRIPPDRPALDGRTTLADFSAAEVLALARAEGFAGQITLEGDQCVWHREINWHGEPQVGDIGHLVFESPTRLFEAGVLFEYEELWTKARAADTGRAYRLEGGGFLGVLIIIGTDFALAIDRPRRAPTDPQINDLKHGKIGPHIPMLFDNLYATGTWERQSAIPKAATQPLSEGKPAISLNGNRAFWHHIDFFGQSTDIELAIAPAAP